MTAAAPSPPTPVRDVPVDLDASWSIHGKMHGGYLLGTIVRAAMRAAGSEHHPHPIAASALFAAAPAPGPAVVRTAELRIGRTFSSYRAVLCQDDQSRVEVLMTAGRLLDDEPMWASPEAVAPTLPAPEQCLWGPEHEPTRSRPRRPPIGSLEVRLDPACAPPPYGPGGRADFRAWARIGTEFDALTSLYVLCDALPPITMDLGIRDWVPTLQLQVVVRRSPAPGWQIARQTARLVAGGLFDEDCTLWDANGRLTAHSRQLAAVRLPS